MQEVRRVGLAAARGRDVVTTDGETINRPSVPLDSHGAMLY